MNGILFLCHSNAFDRVTCSTNVPFPSGPRKKLSLMDTWHWFPHLVVSIVCIVYSNQIKSTKADLTFFFRSILCHHIIVCAHFQTICYISRFSVSLFKSHKHHTKQKKGWKHVVWTNNSNRIIVPRYANNSK